MIGAKNIFILLKINKILLIKRQIVFLMQLLFKNKKVIGINYKMMIIIMISY